MKNKMVNSRKGLQPLEFEECIVDSPEFRENLNRHEKELDHTSQQIKRIIKEVRELVSAAKGKWDLRGGRSMRLSLVFPDERDLPRAGVGAGAVDVHVALCRSKWEKHNKWIARGRTTLTFRDCTRTHTCRAGAVEF